jgi:hypothetical protein
MWNGKLKEVNNVYIISAAYFQLCEEYAGLIIPSLIGGAITPLQSKSRVYACLI